MGTAYYALSTEKVLEHLQSSESGLSNEEAARRLEQYGYNELPEKHHFSAAKVFFNQFRSFLVGILLLAAVISLFLGDTLDAVAIFAIVVLNAILGFAQEFKAERAMAALRKLAALSATVTRGGKKEVINSRELVPGDLVMLNVGDKVPADIRLLEVHNLEIDQAVLTGESVPARKEVEPLEGDKSVNERSNIAYKNTVVTFGRAAGIVIATGTRTEFGKIAGIISTIEETETPLHRRLDTFGKQLGLVVIGIVLLLYVIGLIAGQDPVEMFIVAVTLAVAAVPEGLPAVITITLALGIQQMAKHNSIVRRMPAVETLGSTKVICSDKTGTITRNEMFLEKIVADASMFSVTGNGYEPTGQFILDGKEISPKQFPTLSKLLMAAGLCNDAELQQESNGQYRIIGDPTEGALIVAAQKGGIALNHERLDEVPFDSDRKMMSTVNRVEGKKEVYAKGAPEIILSKSISYFSNGKVRKMDEMMRKNISGEVDRLASDAYRVLALAYKEFREGAKKEEGLVYLGLVAMTDPPRKEIREAIGLCNEAGVGVKMITGDNPLTAVAIARKIGLPEGEVVEGKTIETLNEHELEEVVGKTAVFARVSPVHKFRIVESLVKRDVVVAVTGDGVNDAPALKKANIGVAMGIKGTDVAKESADLVLKDDDFSTIVIAIREGRRIYSNIKSFTKYMLSVNFSEIGVVVVTTLFRLPLPYIPLQILWLNLATDSLPALSLGSEKGSQGLMQQPPRPARESIFHNVQGLMIVTAIIAVIVTLGGYGYGLQEDWAAGIDPFDLDAPSHARTIALTTLIVFELFFVFNCREEGKTAFELSPLSNLSLLAAVLISLILHIVIVYSPFFTPFFHFVPLTLEEWAIIFVLGVSGLFTPYLNRGVQVLIRRKK